MSFQLFQISICGSRQKLYRTDGWKDNSRNSVTGVNASIGERVCVKFRSPRDYLNYSTFSHILLGSKNRIKTARMDHLCVLHLRV